jgi:uncharacterized membrane protein YqiK
MTVEEIYQDRQKFSEAVFNVASRDLVNMGVTVVSYTLQAISDEVGCVALPRARGRRRWSPLMLGVVLRVRSAATSRPWA